MKNAIVPVGLSAVLFAGIALVSCEDPSPEMVGGEISAAKEEIVAAETDHLSVADLLAGGQVNPMADVLSVAGAEPELDTVLTGYGWQLAWVWIEGELFCGKAEFHPINEVPPLSTEAGQREGSQSVYAGTPDRNVELVNYQREDEVDDPRPFVERHDAMLTAVMELWPEYVEGNATWESASGPVLSRLKAHIYPRTDSDNQEAAHE